MGNTSLTIVVTVLKLQPDISQTQVRRTTTSANTPITRVQFSTSDVTITKWG